MNLSPFYLQTIEYSCRNFAFIKPLELAPSFDETQQLYYLEYADLGIDVFAYTRDQLDQELREQIVFLWDSYALADDAELTETATQLKINLLNRLKEIIDAA